MTNEKLIEKIRKLLALSESSNEAEAAVAASKAQALLAEHNLSLAQVENVEEVAPIGRHGYNPGRADPWRRSIVFAAARLYMCRAINDEVLHNYVSRKTGEKRMKVSRSFLFVGREHNAEVCKEMCDYLFSTTVRLSREYSDLRREQLAFRRGCGERLADRLGDLHFQQSIEKKTGPSGGLPALYRGERKLIDEWVEKRMSLTRMRAGSSNLDGQAAEDGAAAGDEVSLSPQVRGPGSATRLLS